MKIVRYLLLCLAVACVLNGCYNDSTDRRQILKVYNWADYIGDGVLDDFKEYYKQQTGEDIQIIYQTFDINEVMLTKIERGHEDFDVVCPSEYIIERMLHKGLLLPIDTVFAHSPNYMKGVSPFIRSQIDRLGSAGRPSAGYAVCYMWGTAGLLYNTKYVKPEEVSSWGCLWNKRFAGKILMKDSYRDAYGAAILYANRRALEQGRKTVAGLMNDYSASAMDTVEKYLKALKPNVAGWEADFGKEMMTKEKAWINMTWSGDARWAIEEAAKVGVHLDYAIPREGSNIWYDGWVIPKYAQNRKAAAYFINFLCRPDIALRNMEANGYVSAVASPEMLQLFTDPKLSRTVDASYFFGSEAKQVKLRNTQYPDISVVNRCSMIRDFGSKTATVLDMWSRVKGDNLNSGIVVFILVVTGLLMAYRIKMLWRANRLRRMQRNRRRQRRISVRTRCR